MKTRFVVSETGSTVHLVTPDRRVRIFKAIPRWDGRNTIIEEVDGERYPVGAELRRITTTAGTPLWCENREDVAKIVRREWRKAHQDPSRSESPAL